MARTAGWRSDSSTPAGSSSNGTNRPAGKYLTAAAGKSWPRRRALHRHSESSGLWLGFVLAYSHGLRISPFFMALICATVFSQFSSPP